MKHLYKYSDFILESQQSLESIYSKYYSDISQNIFMELVKSDPTYKEKTNKQGIYMKWLLNLYIKKKLKLEDAYKATEYLTVYHQFKHKINKDISTYKSLQELFKDVEPYIIKDETIIINEDERKLTGQFKEVFRNDKYRIIIPQTLKASKYFGRGTEWCTTKKDNFEYYTNDMDASKICPFNLYILYTENLDDRLQFHFDKQQFMDISDADIDTDKFYKENPDIEKFFEKLINNVFLNHEPYEQMEVFCEYLDYTYSEEQDENCDISEIHYGALEYDGQWVFGSLYLVDKKIDISEIQNTFKELYDAFDISYYKYDYINSEVKIEYDKTSKYIILMHQY